MSYQEFATYAAILLIAGFTCGRKYERWSAKRYSDAAQRIKDKYQAYRGSTERI